MKAVIVYESMYGNTHHVAAAIGKGLSEQAEVVVVPVHEASHALVGSADLLVVGGPTHIHGMSTGRSRHAAVEGAGKSPDLELEPDAEGPGLRDWFADFDSIDAAAAAFDTRVSGPPALTGRASKGIARRLRRLGASMLDEPQSFLVSKGNELEPGQEDRARVWGEELMRVLSQPDAAEAVN